MTNRNDFLSVTERRPGEFEANDRVIGIMGDGTGFYIDPANFRFGNQSLAADFLAWFATADGQAALDAAVGRYASANALAITQTVVDNLRFRVTTARALQIRAGDSGTWKNTGWVLPDVAGMIAAHNTAGTAHPDIRQEAANAQADIDAHEARPHNTDATARAAAAAADAAADAAQAAIDAHEANHPGASVPGGGLTQAERARLLPTGATNGQIAKWNGTAWVAANDEQGSGGGGNTFILYTLGNLYIRTNSATPPTKPTPAQITATEAGVTATTAPGWQLTRPEATATQRFVYDVHVYGTSIDGTFGVLVGTPNRTDRYIAPTDISGKQDTLPALAEGQVWKGGPGNTIVAGTDEQGGQGGGTGSLATRTRVGFLDSVTIAAAAVNLITLNEDIAAGNDYEIDMHDDVSGMSVEFPRFSGEAFLAKPNLATQPTTYLNALFDSILVTRFDSAGDLTSNSVSRWNALKGTSNREINIVNVNGSNRAVTIEVWKYPRALQGVKGDKGDPGTTGDSVRYVTSLPTTVAEDDRNTLLYLTQADGQYRPGIYHAASTQRAGQTPIATFDLTARANPGNPNSIGFSSVPGSTYGTMNPLFAEFRTIAFERDIVQGRVRGNLLVEAGTNLGGSIDVTINGVVRTASLSLPVQGGLYRYYVYSPPASMQLAADTEYEFHIRATSDHTFSSTVTVYSWRALLLEDFITNRDIPLNGRGDHQLTPAEDAVARALYELRTVGLTHTPVPYTVASVTTPETIEQDLSTLSDGDPYSGVLLDSKHGVTGETADIIAIAIPRHEGALDLEIDWGPDATLNIASGTTIPEQNHVLLGYVTTDDGLGDATSLLGSTTGVIPEGTAKYTLPANATFLYLRSAPTATAGSNVRNRKWVYGLRMFGVAVSRAYVDSLLANLSIPGIRKDTLIDDGTIFLAGAGNGRQQATSTFPSGTGAPNSLDDYDYIVYTIDMVRGTDKGTRGGIYIPHSSDAAYPNLLRVEIPVGADNDPQNNDSTVAILHLDIANNGNVNIRWANGSVNASSTLKITMVGYGVTAAAAQPAQGQGAVDLSGYVTTEQLNAHQNTRDAHHPYSPKTYDEILIFRQSATVLDNTSRPVGAQYDGNAFTALDLWNTATPAAVAGQGLYACSIRANLVGGVWVVSFGNVNQISDGATPATFGIQYANASLGGITTTDDGTQSYWRVYDPVNNAWGPWLPIPNRGVAVNTVLWSQFYLPRVNTSTPATDVHLAEINMGDYASLQVTMTLCNGENENLATWRNFLTETHVIHLHNVDPVRDADKDMVHDDSTVQFAIDGARATDPNARTIARGPIGNGSSPAINADDYNGGMWWGNFVRVDDASLLRRTRLFRIGGKRLGHPHFNVRVQFTLVRE